MKTGPTTLQKLLQNEQMCNGCQYLKAMTIFSAGKAEVVEAKCNHPQAENMFLGGFLLGRNAYVDTPADCPTLKENSL